MMASSSTSPMATAAKSTVKQPPWSLPGGSDDSRRTPHPRLHIYNSLTRSKVPFVPIDSGREGGAGKGAGGIRDPKARGGKITVADEELDRDSGENQGPQVTWYACGPTVYDDAHLGHARNYVSTDILRRILRDYFGFRVRFVMNVTDVDDKIILRGRQQYLLKRHVDRHKDGVDIDFVNAAYRTYIQQNLPLVEKTQVPLPQELSRAVEKAYGHVLKGEALEAGAKAGDKEAKIKMHVNTILRTARAMSDEELQRSDPELFHAAVQDVLCPFLDGCEGSNLSSDNHSIFMHLTKKYEDQFFRDMRELNVLDPDDLTRVTEYGSQIANFVDTIVENKFGYATSDGSVYFDIDGFEAAGHDYARLEPWNRSNKELQADGEGALSQKATEKRSPADFAIWKASKPGEPSWPSKWGAGRPGWHIECSAMASAKLGRQMDIHSGGIDLAFPHHDNELAQSEAYWANSKKQQWVNYFLHMGHLSIAGSKMSKSLKNFTTVRSALERGDWTPRSLRIVFLLGGWKDGVEITDDLVQAGRSWEDRVDNFFLNVKDAATTKFRDQDGNGNSSLCDAFNIAQDEMYEALCDSFNTPKAMAIISRLIGTFNSADRNKLVPDVVQAMGNWVTKMVNIFGLNGSASPKPAKIGWSGIDIPAVAIPYVFPLRDLRDQLRKNARSKAGLSKRDLESALQNTSLSEDAMSDPSSGDYAQALKMFKSEAASLSSSPDLSKEVLALCDRVRDIDLWKLNIYLEDREDPQPALVRPVTAALAAARQEKDERSRQKEADKLKREQQAREKAERGQLSHLDMFRNQNGDGANEFSQWDAEGMPTKMANGEEVAKSRMKKLRKEWERQKKAHEAWRAANVDSGGSS